MQRLGKVFTIYKERKENKINYKDPEFLKVGGFEMVMLCCMMILVVMLQSGV